MAKIERDPTLVSYAGGEAMRMLATGLLAGVYVSLACLPIFTLLAAVAAGRKFTTQALSGGKLTAGTFARYLREELHARWWVFAASALAAVLLVLYLLLALGAQGSVQLASALGIAVVTFGICLYGLNSGQQSLSELRATINSLRQSPLSAVLLVSGIIAAWGIGVLAPVLSPFITGILIFGLAVVHRELQLFTNEAARVSVCT